MKRLHVHVAVTDLDRSTAFYSTLFVVQPPLPTGSTLIPLLADPPANLANPTRAGRDGLDHLGLQVDTDAEVEEIEARLAAAEEKVAPQRDAACCYAQANKSWTRDPAGGPWETFHTMAAIQYSGSDHQPLDDVEKPATGGACCG